MTATRRPTDRRCCMVHDDCGEAVHSVSHCSHCGERLRRDHIHIEPGPGLADPGSARLQLRSGGAQRRVRLTGCRLPRSATSDTGSHGSRTPACSPGTGSTSTTSPSPGCSTRTSCAARSRTRDIRGIDVDEARRHPGVIAVVHRRRHRGAHPPLHGLPAAARPLPPDVLRARHRQGAARRRPGGAGRSPSRGTSPKTPRSSSSSTTRSSRRSRPSSTRSTPRVRRSGPDPAATCCNATAATTATSTLRSRDADRVVRERFVQHRYSNQPMETRGCVAEVDPDGGHGAATTRPRRTAT